MNLLLLTLAASTISCSGSLETTTTDTSATETALTEDTSTTNDTSSTTETGGTTGSPGCDAETFTTDSYEMTHEGLSRKFRVFVPSSHDPSTPAPLVLYFHGWGGSQNEFVGNADVQAEAEALGMILAAPLGLGAGPPDRSYSSWSFSGSTTGLDGDGVNPNVPGDTTDICDDATTSDYDYSSCAGVAENGCAWTHCQADDVDFVLALITELEAGLCIDSAAIFATGGSNGGMFSWELGQNPRTASKFRALAPLIGLPHRGYLASKGTENDLPVLSITGTRDRTVPPGDWEDPSFTETTDGDHFYYTGATAITQVWAASHGCDISIPAATVDVGVDNFDCRSYCPSEGALPQVLDCRAGMGHTYDYGTTVPLMLGFFEAHL
jgi:poly(3-hydroxybutyrate) depolymerase